MSPSRLSRVLNLACLCLVALSSPSLQAQTDPITIYKGATLIDGTGAPAQTNVSILVRGQRIIAIQPATVAIDPGVKIIDVTGLYVSPGLINTHVHIATNSTRAESLALMRRDLYSGITAERDMAGDTRQLAELARAALLGEVEGPDIFYAALMAGPSFFKDPRTHAAARGTEPGGVPWMRSVTPQTDLHLAVAQAHGTGATAIKIYADLPSDLVAAITNEAHNQGMLVWAHGTVFPATATEVVDAGVDVVSHADMLAITHPPNTYADSHLHPVAEQMFADDFGPTFTRLIEDMKRRGTILDATLYVFQQTAAQKAAHPQPDLLSIAERATQAAYKAGIPISTGTDSEDERNKDWSPLRDELVLLQDGAAMQPADILRSATIVSARTFGQEHEMGTIEPGKLANLVFTSSNPLDGMQVFRSVVLTVKRGHAYWRKDFDLAK
jgi:imidazolonepropionase-like amidohydrolase